MSEHTAEIDATCSTPGCPGDPRYAAPGRGHLPTCDYPRSMLAEVAAQEEAHAGDEDRPHYRARVLPPAEGRCPCGHDEGDHSTNRTCRMCWTRCPLPPAESDNINPT